jgi:hypothetical protein
MKWPDGYRGTNWRNESCWTLSGARDSVVSGVPPFGLFWTVHHMATQGLSNRQIGQRLCISPRTVGSHLYRRFPKLGIANRAQLAAVIADSQRSEVAKLTHVQGRSEPNRAVTSSATVAPSAKPASFGLLVVDGRMDRPCHVSAFVRTSRRFHVADDKRDGYTIDQLYLYRHQFEHKCEVRRQKRCRSLFDL